MPASNVSWGIEVGAGAIKAIKIEVDDAAVRVLDFAVINHPKVLSTPDLDPHDGLRPSLGVLTTSKDLSGAMVAISSPGHQSFARFAKLPPVEAKKVPDIVKFEAVQQIPFPLEDVEWDYQTFISPDSPEVEVGIFAITRPRIMDQLALLNEVGITPDLATISPVAAYNALAHDLEFTEKTPGTIILDVGATASDLVIAEAGRVWIRTFPVGGHQFTEALIGAFPNLSYVKAERLKREAEQSKHARHIFQAMRPVFTDLVQEIQRSIGYYQSIHPGAELKRLIGLGSTFHLPGLRKYLKQQLQIDVYRLDQFKRPVVDPSREAEFNASAMNLCTAYGLALQAAGAGTLNANLMPVKVVRDAMWKRKLPWFAAAAGAAAATAAVAFLRPLLDNTAFTGAERPSEIARASSEARQLSNEAKEAGVTEAATGDLTASQLVTLVDHRTLYPQIVDDLASIASSLGAAERASLEEGAEANGFELVDFQEGFQPAAQQGSGRGFANQPTPSGQAGGDPTIDLSTHDHVLVRVAMESASINPQFVVDEVVDRWFEANERREGVQYQVVAVSGQPFWSLEQIASRPGGAPPRPGMPGGPGMTGTGRPIGRLGPGAAGPGGQLSPPGMSNPGGPGGIRPGGGSPAPQAATTDLELIRQMEQVAGIDPAAIGADRDARWRLNLVYAVVINPPAAGSDT